MFGARLLAYDSDLCRALRVQGIRPVEIPKVVPASGAAGVKVRKDGIKMLHVVKAAPANVIGAEKIGINEILVRTEKFVQSFLLGVNPFPQKDMKAVVSVRILVNREFKIRRGIQQFPHGGELFGKAPFAAVPDDIGTLQWRKGVAGLLQMLTQSDGIHKIKNISHFFSFRARQCLPTPRGNAVQTT